jgi:linalool 8-monooxygenase
MKLECAEVGDPDVYQRGEGRALLARLRKQAPVWWTPHPSGGFWSVLRYKDIVAASKNPRVFSSARMWGGHRIADEAESEITKGLEASMLSMDPPEHTQYRQVVAPAFTPDRLRALEENIRGRVTAILDAISPRGECELVTSVAANLPIQVIAALLGAPEEDGQKLFEWSNVLIGEDDPEMRPSPEQLQSSAKEMGDYALKLWLARMRKPGDDIVSMLVNSEVDGEPLSVKRYYNTFFLLLIAGNESVRHSIANGIIALAEHPAEKQRLLDDPSLIPLAAKEIVRWVSPVLHMRRTATEDTEIAEQRIAKGDKVVLWYLSGNFDEEVFAAPERFDVGRRGAPQLGFGIGQHHCLGWRLAELQLTVLLQELLTRFPDLAPAGPARRMRSNFMNGIKALTVRFTARS